MRGMRWWPIGSGPHLAVALLASAAVVLGSPQIGALRSAVFVAFPAQYRGLMGGAVVLATAALVIGGAVRIRTRRLPRFALLSASVALGVVVSRAMRSGDPNVDAVEAFHFVEYGVLTVLFCRVWRPWADVSSWMAPALATVAVSVCDEWLQWFVPLRAGEMRDVWMNVVAMACGLLFAMALAPAQRPLRVPPGTSLWLAGAATAVVVLGAGFFSTAHRGYRIQDAEIGTFVSIDSGDALLALSKERQQRWRHTPPLTQARVGREDQYLSEALWHVRRRNDAYADGDFASAWGENRILETFYAPALDTPSYASATGLRWPEAQRQAVDSGRVRQPAVAFVSRAHPYPIYPWSRAAYWAVIGAVCTGVLLVGLVIERRVTSAVAGGRGHIIEEAS